jgi:hypothetical protein
MTALEFLLSCATPATLKEVRRRLRGDQKRLELLLLRTLNPCEHLTNAEEGLLRGIDAKTIGKKKLRGEIRFEP